jgi:hypothetical protein
MNLEDYSMKRTSLIVLGVLAVSAGAFAQDPNQAAIDKATRALPSANLKAATGVIKWKPDYTYDTLKPSTNGMVCYDISDYPTHKGFMVECTMMANLPRAAQNLKIEAIADAKARQAAFDAAEKDGTRVKPQYGSVWYHLMGADEEHLRTHMTIAVPGATKQTTGLPEARGDGTSVWVMNAGTTTAHLMTPGE